MEATLLMNWAHAMNWQARQCTYKCNIEARSRNQCCCGKAISITQFESVFVVLVIKQAERMRGIILPSVACLLLRVSYYFTRYLVKEQIFIKIIFNIVYVFQFSLQIFLSFHQAFCRLFNYTHQYIHIYIYMCVCVCVCARARVFWCV